jgi:hypothetical protein
MSLIFGKKPIDKNGNRDFIGKYGIIGIIILLRREI